MDMAATLTHATHAYKRLDFLLEQAIVKYAARVTAFQTADWFMRSHRGCSFHRLHVCQVRRAEVGSELELVKLGTGTGMRGQHYDPVHVSMYIQFAL